MWILPETHPLFCLYAPATGESREVLSEQLERSESSLMWRSKPTQLRTWLTRWKRDKWFRRLSGRILKLSTQESFEKALTYSPEAIHANHLVPQADAKGRTTPGTYGPTSDGSLKTAPPLFASLKMSRDTSRLDSPQSSAIWKKMVTEHRGEYSQRLKQALHTSGNESFLWPTTTTTQDASNCGGPSQLKRNSIPLNTAVGLQDQGRSNTSGRLQGLHLWPTPRVSPVFAFRKREEKQGFTSTLDIEVLPERPRAQKDLKNVKAKLNPDWVEQLMGLPPNWTQLSPKDANRVDRLRLLGNGVVPQTAEKAFRTLIQNKVKTS